MCIIPSDFWFPHSVWKQTKYPYHVQLNNVNFPPTQIHIKRLLQLYCAVISLCRVSSPAFCSSDGVPSALRPGDRTQPPMLGQHQRSGVRLHQRCGSGHGGQLPGKRPAANLLTWIHFFFGPQTSGNNPDCTVLFVRLITPNRYTMWVPVWHFQQGCCSCACSVCSPTGWLWRPSTTGWPISEWLWHWEPWSLSSSVSFTY